MISKILDGDVSKLIDEIKLYINTEKLKEAGGIMKIKKLENQIREKKSFLCIGLDIDLDRIPAHIKGEQDPIFSFAKEIIDSTNKFAVAYKPNIAFFRSLWCIRMGIIRKIINYLNSEYPEIFTIADAKEEILGILQICMLSFFSKSKFDSITISPYMGKIRLNHFFLLIINMSSY